MLTTCLRELPKTARLSRSMAELPWSSSNKAGSGRLSAPTSLQYPRLSENRARALGAWRCTMTVNNPLADNFPDHEDQSLVLRARSGDHQALEDLVQRHQTRIYNIAVRMLHHPQDAEDVTQEILIKVLTRLSSFEGRSSFRTWLYRIMVNHVLNMKRGQVEPASMDFAYYGAAIDDTPELELADPKGTSADTDLLVTEAMLSCKSRSSARSRVH